MTTLKQLVQSALDVQDACNLSGVVHSFSRVVTQLREIARAEGWEGTDRINQHPICVLYSSKISSLSLADDTFSKAYNWAMDYVKEQNIDQTNQS